MAPWIPTGGEPGRFGPHPVAPNKTSWAARSIESDGDVLEPIRLNSDRVVAR
jgi:hypothetical protein